MYLRFASLDPSSAHALVPHGVFSSAYALIRSGEIDATQEQSLRELLGWFCAYLPIPRDPRIGDHALFWLKDDAEPSARKMWDLVTLLRLCDRDVQMIKSEYPGRIVYEDRYQVAAIPRRGTLRGVEGQQIVVLRSLRINS